MTIFNALPTMNKLHAALAAQVQTKISATVAASGQPLVHEPTCAILAQVHAERCRQNHLVDSGVLPWSCDNPDIPDGGKLMVLGEEFGEVSRAAYECYNSAPITGPISAKFEHERRAHLREELIQLAAVAVAWVQSIDEE